jgi:hypothetical protein
LSAEDKTPGKKSQDWGGEGMKLKGEGFEDKSTVREETLWKRPNEDNALRADLNFQFLPRNHAMRVQKAQAVP